MTLAIIATAHGCENANGSPCSTHHTPTFSLECGDAPAASQLHWHSWTRTANQHSQPARPTSTANQHGQPARLHQLDYTSYSYTS